MTIVLDLTMRNTLEGLVDLIERVDGFLQIHSLPPVLQYKVKLVLEEILTNIVKYAFNNAEFHEIAVRLTLNNAALTIEFTDDGRAFDPLMVQPPQLKNFTIDSREGGLGIHLVRNAATSITYRRAEGRNLLTVGFNVVDESKVGGPEQKENFGQ